MTDINCKEDDFFRRMKSHLMASPSRGNMRGIDPDNPYEIRRHEQEALEFLNERLNLEANILYVHGFASSGHSETARTIQKYLPKSKVFSPDLPVDPKKAMKLLQDTVEKEKIDAVVGTSMGGMLAQKLRGIPKVLVNPAFHVSESMRKKIGTVPFFSRREDGATEFKVTPSLCDEYQKIESNQFDSLNENEKAITYGLFGTDDEIVNNQAEFDQHYPNKMIFPGGHRLSADAVHDYVIEAILKLLKHP